MTALDAADVQKAGFAADQGTAREHGLWQRQQAAGGDGARTVGQPFGGDLALGVFQVPADVRVGLPALEFFKRAQVGVAVVQPGDKAHGDLVAGHVVQERAAVGAVVHWPASGVHHQAGFVAGRFDFPELLDADAVALRVAAFVEFEFGNHLLAQMAARTFGKDSVFAEQFHANLEVGAGLTAFLDAHVAGGHPLDGTVVVVEHFGSGKTGEDFHAQAFGLACQPARQRPQADDVVAVVLAALGQQHVGGAVAAGLGQEQHGLIGHWLLQRRAGGFPVGQQFGQRPRVKNGPREDVGTGLGAFFQHHHRDFFAFFGGELLEPNGGRQAGGAATDDDHVVFH
ncbi:hypothetical protein GALL_451540 [mine drainage metagenome]|uniref:Uncharacterized protein n=1 Tax=mine drainage metagenome TaxID=410659 RepID=A0A1J5Q6X4_9ZZZZ